MNAAPHIAALERVCGITGIASVTQATAFWALVLDTAPAGETPTQFVARGLAMLRKTEALLHLQRAAGVAEDDARVFWDDIQRTAPPGETTEQGASRGVRELCRRAAEEFSA